MDYRRIDGCARDERVTLYDAIHLTMAHWNILAQELCRGFDKISDDAPIL